MKTKTKAQKQFAQHIGEDYSHLIDTKTEKHTPAPWKISSSQKAQAIEPYPVAFFAVSGNGQAIGRVYNGGFPNTEANAQLIAASPELLRATKLALDNIRYGHVPDAEAVSVLIAAIAKAEGK